MHSRTNLDRSTGCGDSPRRWRECALAKRVFILHNLMMRVGDRLVADLDLTSSRWLLLGAVADRPEPPTMSELSNDAVLSLQNVSRMVAAMEAVGLLERVPTPGGGRAVRVRLTEKGRELHEATKERGCRFATGFLEGIGGAEVERLEIDLDRLIDNLERLETQLMTRRAETPAAQDLESEA